MQVIILCGGKNIRMGKILEDTPKALFPIQGIPILFRIMKHYMNYGLNEFIICCGKNINYFKKRFNSLSDEEREYLEKAVINIIYTGEDTNTGGRIKKVESLIKGDFCVTYGDGLSSINIEKLIKYHKYHKKLATMTVIRPRITLGIAHMDNEDFIVNFKQKAKIKYWANGGFFVFSKEILEYINEDSTLETDTLKLLSNMKQIKSYYHHGFWHCMDTPKDYNELNKIYKRVRLVSNNGK